MKILLIVDFRENAENLRSPSPSTGLYAIITEDESVLKFQAVNKRHTPISSPLWCDMENYFFSEYNANKWPAWRYLNRCFRPYRELVNEPHDKLVVCEV